MDAQAIWQENKNFLLCAGGGLLLFFGIWWGIDTSLGQSARRESARIRRAQNDLRKEYYGARDLERTREENIALRSALDRLHALCDFKAREAFKASPGSAVESRYISTVYKVREDLLTLAGRANMALPKDLGLSAQAPTRPAELERTLECLDAVDRFVRLALDAGMARIDEIRVTIDPRVRSGRTIADTEENLVRIKALGDPRAIEACLVGLRQTPGGPLLAKSIDVTPSRSKVDELTLELEVAVLHPRGDVALDDDPALASASSAPSQPSSKRSP